MRRALLVGAVTDAIASPGTLLGGLMDTLFKKKKKP